MKILYFIEPYYEFNNPKFRVPTLKSVILKQIEKIYEDYNDKHEYIIFTSKEIIDCCDFDFPNYIKIIKIDLNIHKKYYNSSIEYALDAYNNPQKIEKLCDEIKKKHGNINPDLVVNYESASDSFINYIFPCAKIVNMMFGPFSRAPYPATTFFSVQGIYGKSEINKFICRELNYEEKEVMRKIRSRAMRCIAELNPLKKIISNIRSKYQYTLLICCQINDYFAFNGCTKFKNQYELVKYTLSVLPKSIGVIVTAHGEFVAQISNEEIYGLHKSYGNLEILNYDIPYISQFIIPYVDGVITVSSSLGFQAALWRKPLIVPGYSHISVLSQSDNINDIIKILNSNDYNKDSILLDILTMNTFFNKHDLDSGKQIISIFEKVLCNTKIIHQNRTAKDIEAYFYKYFRGLELKNILASRKIKIEPDFFRIALSNAEVISFDIFDTLILRPFVEPWNLFIAVEEKAKQLLKNSNFDFVYFRRTAEADVRRNSGTSIEVTIEEIYQRIKELTALEDEIIKEIMQYEIECEIIFCTPSHILQKEYNFAKIICKKISIISDIYLHESTIRKILYKSNYRDFDLLYVSADKKIRKHDGKIFKEYIRYVVENWGTVPSKCLHVGDNKIADLEMPRKYGMQSYCLPKSIDNFSKSVISSYFKNDIRNVNISSSFISSVIANRFYNDTFNKINTESSFLGDPYILGYCAVGPLVLGFIQWLHYRAIIRDNNHLYFLARDGWLPYKAYNMYYKSNALSNSYFYCSRRSASLPTIFNKEDMYEIAMRSFEPRPLKDLLMTRFGISEEEIPKSALKSSSLSMDEIVSPIKSQAKLRLFFDYIFDLIISHANKEREAFKIYCNQQKINTNIEKGHIGFVDIGYSGSMQNYISKLYKTDNIDGYYFLTHFKTQLNHQKLYYDAFLASFDDHNSIYRHKLNDYVFLFESMLSSPEGSLTFFEYKNRIIKNFIFEKNEDKRVLILNKIHDGCLSFINDVNVFGVKNKDFIEIPNRIAEKVFLSYAKNPTRLDASIFVSIGVENLYGGGSVKLIENSYNTLISESEKKGLVERSKWHEGALKYYENTSIRIDYKLKKPSSNYFTHKQKLHNKLDNTSEVFFKDSKNVFIRYVGIIFSKLSPNSFLRKKIMQISHSIIDLID